MTLRPSTQAIMDTFLETQVTAQTRTRFELTLNHQDTRAQDDRANTAGDRLNTATNQRWLAQAEGPHTVPGQDRPCQGCGQPLSRYNPGSFCQSCTSAGRQHQPAPPAELLIDGSRLAGLRCKRGMTQRLLADRAGISFSLIEKLERNARRSASLASLTAIARALNLPLDTLLDGSPAPDDLRRDHQRISSALLPQAGGKDGEDPVNRREFLSLSALTVAHRKVAAELTASIAAGDGGPLATVQTTHGTDLVIAALTDQGSTRKLRTWMSDGHTPILRVNAAGILAKLQDQDTSREGRRRPGRRRRGPPALHDSGRSPGSAGCHGPPPPSWPRDRSRLSARRISWLPGSPMKCSILAMPVPAWCSASAAARPEPAPSAPRR